MEAQGLGVTNIMMELCVMSQAQHSNTWETGAKAQELKANLSYEVGPSPSQAM